MVVTESDAGDGRNLVALQKLVAELNGAHAELGEVQEEVESTLRLDDLDLGHLGKAVVDVVTAEVVLLPQVIDEALVTGEGLDGTILGKGGGVGGGVVLNELDVLSDVLGSGGVTEAPAGHGVALGEAVDGDGDVVELRAEGSHGDVLLTIIDEVLVNFIRDDEDVLFQRDLADGEQLLLGVDGTRGVVRGGEDDHLGARGHGCLELLSGNLPAVFGFRLHEYGGAAADLYHGGVAHPVGGGDDDLVPGVEDGAQGLVDGGLGTGGHADLVDVVVQPVVALQLVADGLAEGGETHGGRVLGLALVERADGRLLDVLRSVLVRLTACEAENLLACGLHLLGAVGNGEGERGLQGRNVVRYKV